MATAQKKSAKSAKPATTKKRSGCGTKKKATTKGKCGTSKK